jgi:hypothetical protein
MKAYICLVVLVSAVASRASIIDDDESDSVSQTLYEESYGADLITENLLEMLAKERVEPEDLAQFLSRATNKKAELLNGLTVGQMLELNKFEKTGCTKEALQDRVAFCSELITAQKDNVRKNMHKFCRNTFHKMVERCTHTNLSFEETGIDKEFVTQLQNEKDSFRKQMRQKQQTAVEADDAATNLEIAFAKNMSLDI